MGLALLTTSLSPASLQAASPAGSAFVYQGRLVDGSLPATGYYDLRFTLFDSVSGSTATGSTLESIGLLVSNGLFTASLDFGVNAFNGDARWLEILVRTNSSSAPFATLTPRQPLMPTPYAVRAGAVPAAGIQGTLSDSALSVNVARLSGAGQTFASAVTLSNVANQFAGNGSGLTGLNASNVSSGTVADVRLSANVALLNRPDQIFAGTNSFSSGLGIGTTHPAADLEIANQSAAGPRLRLRGSGGGGAAVTVDLTTYDPGSYGPSSRIQATDNNWSSDVDILMKQPGANTNALVSRLRISADGNVGIGTTSPDRPLTVRGTGGNAEWISLDATDGTAAWHINNRSGGLNFAQTGVRDNRLFISTNGNVGIGTNNPVASLTVMGDIRLGQSAELHAPGAPESLRMVRGVVLGDGTIAAGTGFTVTRNGTGSYTITFSTNFAGYPAVTVTPLTNAGDNSSVASLASNTFDLLCFHSGTPSQPAGFSFIAIGAP